MYVCVCVASLAGDLADPSLVVSDLVVSAIQQSAALLSPNGAFSRPGGRQAGKTAGGHTPCFELIWILQCIASPPKLSQTKAKRLVLEANKRCVNFMLLSDVPNTL